MLVEDVGGVLQDIVSMVVAHEAGIAEGQSSSNFSGSNNIFDFVVDTCNETVFNKKNLLQIHCLYLLKLRKTVQVAII